MSVRSRFFAGAVVALALHPAVAAAETQVLLDEAFAYPEGALVDHVASARWLGRFAPPDASAVARDGRVYLYPGRILSTRGTFLNARDTFTHVAVDILGPGELFYRMSQAGFGVHVAADGRGRIVATSGNLGFAGQQNSQVFEVVAAERLHVAIYLEDNRSQVLITDALGTQSTPCWSNQRMVGNVPYALSLDGGAAGSVYDNVLVSHTDDAPPPGDPPRAPVVVTPSLIEGEQGKPYLLPPDLWNMVDANTRSPQLRADGGVGPLAYAILGGALPAGLSLTTRYEAPTNDSSPPQWLGILEGTPTVAGSFPLTIQITDAQGRSTTADRILTIAPPGPPHVFFQDAFDGPEGQTINDTAGSQWTGQSGNASVSAAYQGGRAQIHGWSTLTAVPRFRNADSRYLHLGVRLFPGQPGLVRLLSSAGYYGVAASYNGLATMTVSSNNLGYALQTFKDTFTVSPRPDGSIGLDIYLRGADSRTLVSGSNGAQATFLHHNDRLEGPAQNGDFTVTLGYFGLYDDLVVEDRATTPELINPVRLDTTALLTAFEGVPYRDTLRAASGEPPYAWTSTPLPSGLSLAPDGVISGAPTAPGSAAVTFTVTDAGGRSASQVVTMEVEADPEHNLLFADRFSLPDGPSVVARDAAHWSTAPNTPTALAYSGGRLAISAHRQGWIPGSFPNDGIEPIQVRWRMNKGVAIVAQINTAWGMEVEYDGLQHVSVRWNDLAFDPYLHQQDFLLETFGEIVTAAIEVRGQEFGLRLEDSKQVYVKGPFHAPRVEVGKPVFLHFWDSTPYGEYQFTSSRAGPTYLDDLTVRRGVWTVEAGSPLRSREELGRRLFFDPILSGDHQRACAGCHRPEDGFTDGRRTAQGPSGQPLGRNTPALVNLALQGAFFWDGRETDLARVALGPLQNPLEMGVTAAGLVAALEAVPEYHQRFAALYPDGATMENASRALGAYLRTLMELRTRYDRHTVTGNVLTPGEDAGQILFYGKAHCAACHSLSRTTPVGQSDQALPIFRATGVPATAAGIALDADPGRGAITHDPLDIGAFRVPGLRNLSRTGPYMHNGVFATLEQVIAFYNVGGGAGVGLPVPNHAAEIEPLGLSDDEQTQLLAFLRALSPEQPNEVEIPTAVPSGLPVGGTLDQAP